MSADIRQSHRREYCSLDAVHTCSVGEETQKQTDGVWCVFVCVVKMCSLPRQALFHHTPRKGSDVALISCFYLQAIFIKPFHSPASS